MDLELDEIHTYLACPAKYKFKYVDKIKLAQGKAVIFKRAMHEAVYYFFYSAMGGRLIRPAEMKDKWAGIWKITSQNITNPMTIILKPSQAWKPGGYPEPKDQYHIKGVELIHNFYHFNHGNPGNVIAVDQDYKVAIDDVNVLGKFELIREILDAEDGKRYIEIVDFKTGDDGIDPFLVKNDFNLTLASYAFRNLFKSTEDRLKYHYLKTGRDIITVRRDNDFNRAKATVKGVANGIKNKDFYPNQSFMCKTCEFKDVCDRVKY
jgi:CRISPR/Cas system-associated exonuclease Cas4 (RecB family)